MPPLTTRQLNRATLARQGLLERLSSPLPAATSAIGLAFLRRGSGGDVAIGR